MAATARTVPSASTSAARAMCARRAVSAQERSLSTLPALCQPSANRCAVSTTHARRLTLAEALRQALHAPLVQTANSTSAVIRVYV